ncbi:Hypothetical Protein FCC1311_076952 [Hondaea fermentalgiana]|uniref:Microbial-type PARG catalytic domain-containing protein n=1 Tax=Hondaea fermentalgiana TaxID=2315210 RepID=A0A2R5GSW7_9STRA|nr:Hypothetical Protein FCC1311_076952 [Hondaea fermentalgiana]|eukprot:GBG31471.1 Hypothetical Protein FCC1311_076952 [Hondaea fermentalgiana]
MPGPSREQVRQRAKALAQETLAVLHEGGYLNGAGEVVRVSDDVSAAVGASEHFAAAHEFPAVPSAKGAFPKTVYALCTDSTFAAARGLAAREDLKNVAVLNFASGRNPGGGFLRGSIAQEECLVRSSGLYPCLARFEYMPKLYYQTNRDLQGEERALNTSCAIYSPKVPVFRQDNLVGAFLDKPFACSVITIPAPNANLAHDALRGDRATWRRNAMEELFKTTLEDRIDRVLAIASEKACDVLVLGAFGCGAYGNDPDLVAGIFRDKLTGKYATCFREVHFAILVLRGNPSADANFIAFQTAFCDLLAVDPDADPPKVPA